MKLDLDDETAEMLRSVLIWAALWDVERNDNKNREVYDRVLAATGIMRSDELTRDAAGNVWPSDDRGRDLARLGSPVHAYTLEKIQRALNDGADLVLDDVCDAEYSATIWVRSVVDLVVNAQVSLLDHPALTLNEVIEANYQAEGDQDVVAMVRSWVTP